MVLAPRAWNGLEEAVEEATEEATEDADGRCCAGSFRDCALLVSLHALRACRSVRPLRGGCYGTPSYHGTRLVAGGRGRVGQPSHLEHTHNKVSRVLFLSNF